MIDKQKLHDVIDAMFNEVGEEIFWDDFLQNPEMIAIGFIEARRVLAYSLVGAETQDEAIQKMREQGKSIRALYADYELEDLLNKLASRVWALNHQAPLA